MVNSQKLIDIKLVRSDLELAPSDLGLAHKNDIELAPSDLVLPSFDLLPLKLVLAASQKIIDLRLELELGLRLELRLALGLALALRSGLELELGLETLPSAPP